MPWIALRALIPNPAPPRIPARRNGPKTWISRFPQAKKNIEPVRACSRLKFPAWSAAPGRNPNPNRQKWNLQGSSKIGPPEMEIARNGNFRKWKSQKWSPKSGVQNLDSKIWTPKFGLPNSGSPIRVPKIRAPKSGLQNLESKIWSPKSGPQIPDPIFPDPRFFRPLRSLRFLRSLRSLRSLPYPGSLRSLRSHRSLRSLRSFRCIKSLIYPFRFFRSLRMVIFIRSVAVWQNL